MLRSWIANRMREQQTHSVKIRQMELISGSHCRYQIRYHVVWKVKFSRTILTPDRAKFLKQIILEIAERYEYTIEAVGTDKSHVHVASCHSTSEADTGAKKHYRSGNVQKIPGSEKISLGRSNVGNRILCQNSQRWAIR